VLAWGATAGIARGRNEMRLHKQPISYQLKATSKMHPKKTLRFHARRTRSGRPVAPPAGVGLGQSVGRRRSRWPGPQVAVDLPWGMPNASSLPARLSRPRGGGHDESNEGVG
jgi:hypothetical protein